MRLLLISEENEFTVQFCRVLRANNDGSYESVVVGRLEAGLSLLRNENWDVVVIHAGLKEAGALVAVDVVQRHNPLLPVVVLTEVFSESLAAEVIRRGAQDCVVPEDLHGGRVFRVLANAAVRKQSLLEVERTYRTLTALIHASPAAIIALDGGGYVRIWNPAAEEIFGWRREEVLNKAYPLLPASRSEELAHQRKLLKSGERVIDIQAPRLRKSGLPVEVRISVAAIRDSDGSITGTVHVLADVTEQKDMQEELVKSHGQLRQFAAGLQSAREEEQARIAREIHDELGQVLTALKYDLSWLENELPRRHKAVRQKSRDMTKAVDSTIQAMQRICTELRPAVLDKLGLIPAVEWQTREFAKRTGIKCRFECEMREVEIQPSQATTVFRILQEALTNIARHSEATEVAVRIESEDKRVLLLSVKDNGRGIRQTEINAFASLGILGMKERAASAGATFEIIGLPEQGTSITLKLELT